MYCDGITWIFRAICCASTAFMVGYLLYEYQKDEDLSVIEYRVLQDFSEDVIYPETTICVWSPLMGDRFDVTGKNNVTHVEYQEYLYGERNFEEKFKAIEFNNVTLDLAEFVQDLTVLDDHNNNLEVCTNVHDCKLAKIKNSFNGFYGRHLHRCYGITVTTRQTKRIESIIISFKQCMKPSSMCLIKFQQCIHVIVIIFKSKICMHYKCSIHIFLKHATPVTIYDNNSFESYILQTIIKLMSKNVH